MDYSPKNTNIVVPESQRNIKSTSFVGAISKGKKVVHYQTFPRSINAERFIEFLRGLRRVYDRGRLTIYMDNLRVHKTLMVRDVYEELDIKVIWAPTYSP